MWHSSGPGLQSPAGAQAAQQMPGAAVSRDVPTEEDDFLNCLYISLTCI